MSKEIEAQVWKLRDIGNLAKFVLIKIADNCREEDGVAWPSVAYLAEHCQMHERTVQRVIGDFVESGVLVVVENGGGRGKSTLYVIDMDRARELHGVIEWRRLMRRGARTGNSGGKARGDRQTPDNESEKKGGTQPPFTDGKGRQPVAERVAASPLKGGTRPPEPLLNRQGRKKDRDLKVTPSKPPIFESPFDDWWRLCPRKVGKGAARGAYKAAARKTDTETLRLGIMRYAMEVGGKDPQFICHPATWLRGERWLDEDEPQRKTDENEHRENGSRTTRRSPHAALLAHGAWAARGSDSGMPGPSGAAPEGAEPDGEGTEGSGGHSAGLPRLPPAGRQG